MKSEFKPRYLIAKAPASISYYYPCGNPDDCTCVNFKTQFDEDFPLIVFLHNPEYQDSIEQYEMMKEKGLILHETEDQETAQKIMQGAIEEYEADS